MSNPTPQALTAWEGLDEEDIIVIERFRVILPLSGQVKGFFYAYLPLILRSRTFRQFGP